MPFIARLKSTGDRISAYTYEGDLKSDFAKGEFICPYCDAEMFPRGGVTDLVTLHFAHHSDCTDEYDRHNESETHIAFKSKIAKELEKQFVTANVIADVDFEVPIEMSWRARGRIADVMVTWEQGWQQAHEVQLSRISVEEFMERTADYERAGVEVVWYLGPDNTQDSRVIEWFSEYFGGYRVAETNFATRENFDRARENEIPY